MALKIIDIIGEHPATVKVYRDSETREYVVKPQWRTPQADYHTDDKQDALDTAKAMVRERDAILTARDGLRRGTKKTKPVMLTITLSPDVASDVEAVLAKAGGCAFCSRDDARESENLRTMRKLLADAIHNAPPMP